MTSVSAYTTAYTALAQLREVKTQYINKTLKLGRRTQPFTVSLLTRKLHHPSLMTSSTPIRPASQPASTTLSHECRLYVTDVSDRAAAPSSAITSVNSCDRR